MQPGDISDRLLAQQLHQLHEIEMPHSTVCNILKRNGKIERFNQTVLREFAATVSLWVLQSAGQMGSTEFHGKQSGKKELTAGIAPKF